MFEAVLEFGNLLIDFGARRFVWLRRRAVAAKHQERRDGFRLLSVERAGRDDGYAGAPRAFRVLQQNQVGMQADDVAPGMRQSPSKQKRIFILFDDKLFQIIRFESELPLPARGTARKPNAGFVCPRP